MNTPAQVVAANSPATLVETWAPFSINSSSGDSMKMPQSWKKVEPKTLSKPTDEPGANGGLLGSLRVASRTKSG